MMKKLSYLALAACAALCFTACSSDDGDNEGSKVKPVSLNVAKYTDQAAQYQFATPLTSVSHDNFQLKGLDITEGGNILLEMYNLQTGKTSYVLEKANISGDSYIMNGDKVKGSVRVVNAAARQTRGTSTVELIINIAVTFSKIETVTYITESGTTVKVTKTIPVAGDEAMKNLVRTWNIRGAIIDLSRSGINAYEEFDSRADGFHMEEILAEAENQGVSLTAKEKDDFKKIIKSIEITSSKFIIRYADGGEDVAGWSWCNAEKTLFRIHFDDSEMGNKFLSDNSSIAIAYNSNLCNLKLTTNITDESNTNWNIILTLKLEAAD